MTQFGAKEQERSAIQQQMVPRYVNESVRDDAPPFPRCDARWKECQRFRGTTPEQRRIRNEENDCEDKFETPADNVPPASRGRSGFANTMLAAR